jgi:hypothetical protein
VKHNPSTLKYFKNKNNPLHKNIDKWPLPPPPHLYSQSA